MGRTFLFTLFVVFNSAYRIYSFHLLTNRAIVSSALHSTSTSTNGVAARVNRQGLLKRDRYVATNRFAVRKSKAAKFEKRWANRKSRLATLQGFKYFHLMRRVTLQDDGTCQYDPGKRETLAGNYISFTIWDKKSDFSRWRSGEAFKEAHGGTSLGAFVSTMVSSALVLKGAPRPAFYDGILVQSIKPETVTDVVDGWRSVDADGSNVLPAECFVACNQFFVPPDNAGAFEERWASQESKLEEFDGFVSFSMLRRDARAKGHGVVEMSVDDPNYVSTTIWRDRQSFDDWKSVSAFKKAHGESTNDEEITLEMKQQPLWSKPPQHIFYEGTLVISCPDGS
mmetsp:Transcript_36977/g.44562  ORF Transcript_36977/g.44562 Transcript_36977/m.44562 type:complete len:339 (-) Transcript_36977:114-1130(-)|eukprot:CAMPEP_0194386056 /NCGR_PEP_ID=MMETSP0174-20130528/84227_1 /TAXON_ID=216777 /ORGANISM="Proboscia alata, Strain PI-D3" /LENGTH=338 /DNA_ID=CAMNT_0039174861 /DNA_START=46 /DNA_END=1065 /DNA_ORIENTATION=+